MRQHRAKKSLGQNFLVDPNQQRRIAEAIDAGPDDTVVEIGPGQGALTSHLARTAGRLILIELDDDLAPALREQFADTPHVTVVHANFMDVNLRELVEDVSRVKVIGNIPYNITTPIIFRLLEPDARPHSIVLMIQREVADRILAPAGSGEYGALSVGVRSVAAVERLFHVPRGAFRPVPRVDSTVIRITPLSPPPLDPREENALRDLTRTLFSWRRKQLQKTLRSADAYSLSAAQLERVQQQIGINLELRPEQLEPADMIRLTRALEQLRDPAQPRRTERDG